MNKYFDENVNGQIIGGDHVICYVTYNGKKQGQNICAGSEQECIKLGKDYIEQV